MLAYLRGTIQAKEVTSGAADRLIIEVAGVGFEVTVSPRTLGLCGQVGQEITLHTSLTIRETDWTIYGFAQSSEKEMFTLVQSVTGVGPKLALALVGTFEPDRLAAAILSEDHKLLSQAPGVGNKVAQRLILELKGKVEGWQAKLGSFNESSSAVPKHSFTEVRSILEGLGYTITEIDLALKQVSDHEPDQDVESLVRKSLRVLGMATR